MKNRTSLHALSFIVSLLALSLACASTSSSRIARNQSLFDSYPTDVQTNLLVGKVDLGYDEDMVRFALGKPNETSTQIDENGETRMWGYTKSWSNVSIGIGRGGYGHHHGFGGGFGSGSRTVKDYTAIIEFRDGKVITARHFDN